MRKISWEEFRTILKALAFIGFAFIISMILNSCETDDSIYEESVQEIVCDEVISFDGSWDEDLILYEDLCVDGILVVFGDVYLGGYDLSFTGNLTVRGSIYFGGGDSILEHNGESLIFDQIRGNGTLRYCPDVTVSPMGDLFPDSINVEPNCQ